MAQEMAAPSPPRPAPTIMIVSRSSLLEPELVTVSVAILLAISVTASLAVTVVEFLLVFVVLFVVGLGLLPECFRSQLRTAPIFAVVRLSDWSLRRCGGELPAETMDCSTRCNKM